MNKILSKKMSDAFIVVLLCLSYSNSSFAQSPFKPEFSKKNMGFTITTSEEGRTFEISDKFSSFIDDKLLIKPGCNNVESISDKLKGQIKNIHGPIIQTQCSAVDEFNKDKKLTQKICLSLAGCFKQQVTNLENLSNVISTARENTASEAVALIAKRNIENMMDFEALKIFTKEKYGDSFIPSSCNNVDVFATENYIPEVPSAVCRVGLIDKGIELAMKNCKLVDFGCHNDFPEFIKNKSINNSKSYTSEFFKKKAKERGDVVLSKNDSITRDIAEIFAKKTISEEERVKEAFDYLNKHHNELDPIFKSYYNVSKESRIYQRNDVVKESLLKWLKQVNTLGADEIEAKLQELKKSEASLLLDKKCKSAMTMKGMCLVVSDVILGVDVHADRNEFNRMTSRDAPLVATSPAFPVELAKQVSRCNSFILNASSNSLAVDTDNLSGEYDLFSSMEGFDNFMDKKIKVASLRNQRADIVLKSDGTVERKNNNNDVVGQKMSIRPKEVEKESDMVLVKKFSPTAPLTESYKKDSEPAISSPTVTQTKKETASGESSPTPQSELNNRVSSENSYVDNRSMLPDRSRMISQNEKINTDYQAIQNENQKNTEAIQEKNKNAELLGRVSELEGRLKKVNESGQEMARKKAESELSVKSSEESKLSRELASVSQEIENFKKNQGKLAPEQAPVAKDEKRERSSEQKFVDEVDSEDLVPESSVAVSPRSSPSNTGSNSGRSDSTSSGGERSSGGSESNSVTKDVTTQASVAEAGKLEGITLTKVDTDNGSMTMTDAIAKLIFAESGRPFYIEEEGLVKIVVPEVSDGKILLDEKGLPIYKKIIKGKVGQFKITGNSKNQRPKESSPADVKRVDEQKNRPTIRYKDFKDAIKASLNEPSTGS